ncbi:MAG: hypothetical protein KA716_01425 [Gloeotrichia echinulata DEX184]
MGNRDWGLGIGDWGHFGKLSASLGIGDTSASSVHRWGLGTLRQAQCIAGDWGKLLTPNS